MVLRTRYFDDFLQRVVAETGVRQIVLVAAGLDTRAYRLRWPEQTRLFELDQPAVLAYKAQVLGAAGAKPTCERQPVGVDLTTCWEAALTAAGFDPQQPSGWLLEGFLFYLSPEDLTCVLERAMNLAATGSFIGFDIINSLTLTSPLTKAWVAMQANSGVPWIGTMDDPQAFLAARNWHATATPLGAPPTNYDRWSGPVIPATLPGMPHLWFVTAQN
jgi:methyltransferase (TIGR00027 family)